MVKFISSVILFNVPLVLFSYFFSCIHEKASFEDGFTQATFDDFSFQNNRPQSREALVILNWLFVPYHHSHSVVD